MVDFIDIQHLAKYLDQIVINDSFGISELIIYKEIFHDINNNSRTDEALTSDLYNSDIDESISNVYLQHHQTFNLEYRSVVEFRIDGDQLTYLIIAVDYWNYVLFENKTDSVKRFQLFDSLDWIHNLFQDIRSLSFIFIKLWKYDGLNLKKFKDYKNSTYLKNDFRFSFKRLNWIL